MQTSWNQWNNTAGSYAPSYASAYPTAPASNVTSQFPTSTPASTPAVASQFPSAYGQPQQQQSQATQQQWQQWEQWQQQYAQWQQQYGDKFQASMQSAGMMPSATMAGGFPTMPPLPPSAPSAQPPPPDSNPPSDRHDESHKRSHDGNGNEDSKKQKTGKGKETLESLIESEKTFDQQFKTWENSFLQWKEENANHPDKVQYKEYESKWESFREQLLQKREVLRKKRETKEAEVAAAAKEAAASISTSTSALQQAGYCTTNAIAQNNPYSMAPPNMMYSMPAGYPQDMSQIMAAAAQPANNYMSSYSMYNMPPPPSLPPMAANLPGTNSLDLADKLPDLSKSSQSLEFLSSSTSTNNAKLIPGLDLVGSDKINSAYMSNISVNSTLFSYNQDMTKPLRTSDDQPFNFPRPPHQNYDDKDAQDQYYHRGRPTFEDNSPSFNQFTKGNFPPPFERRNQNVENNDRFANQNNSRPAEYNNDFKYRGGPGGGGNFNDDRNELRNTSFTPNFNSEKYAKYLEDEYDDSRFRDPEPPEKKSDYGRDNYNRNNYSNRQQNYRNDSNNYNKRDFGDGRNARGGFNDRQDGRSQFNDRQDSGFGSFNRDRDGGNRFGNRNQFGRGASNDNSGRNSFGRNMNETMGKFDNVDGERKLQEPPRPVSLLDLPMMKPPDAFDRKKPPPDMSVPPPFPPNNATAAPPLSEPPKPFSLPEIRFLDKTNNSTERDLRPAVNAMMHPPPALPAQAKNLPAAVEREPFVPKQIFEYDHICRNSDSGKIPSFEPIYVFDYGHGKKKAADYLDLKAKPSVVAEVVAKVQAPFKKEKPVDGQGILEEKNEKIEEVPQVVALPQRTKTIEEQDPNPPLPQQTKTKTTTAEHVQNIENELSSLRDDPVISATSLVEQKSTEEAARLLDSSKNGVELLTKVEQKPWVTCIEDILCLPGTKKAAKLVIIMRGPPGSGKTYTAKLIKDKETELSGSASRIISLDDYFTVEDLDDEEESTTSMKNTTNKNIKYEYNVALEPSYMELLIKLYKKTIIDGYFPLIIIDCINDKVKKYEEMYHFAKSKGFQVYICEMERNLSTCCTRNIHNRSEEDIAKLINEWEPTPPTHPLVDVSSLLQPAADAVMQVVSTTEESADVDKNDESQKCDAVGKKDENDEVTEIMDTEDVQTTTDAEKAEVENGTEGYTSYMEVLCASKWEKMEQTEEKLDRLDGVHRKRASTTSFKDWLQLPDDEGELSWYSSSTSGASDASKGSGTEVSVSKKKRVRWADLEERVAQQKMRKIGFVVGQTDWNRMMDPTFGGNKLTQTKYFKK